MKFTTQAVARRVIVVLGTAFVLTEGIRSVAQTQPASQTMVTAQSVLLREGTEVALKLRQELTSKTAAEGDSVNLTLDQDLKVGAVTVAKAGSGAVGTITHAQKAGVVGRPGDLGLRVEYLKADDATIRLRGTHGKQGKGREGTAVALTVVFGPIGLIKHGRNAQFREGTPLVAYVDQDIELRALD